MPGAQRPQERVTPQSPSGPAPGGHGDTAGRPEPQATMFVPDGPGTPTADPGAADGHATPGPGHEREYLMGVLLTFLTFGVYHFHYHYRTHDELSRQLGRSNDIRGPFAAYVVLVAVALIGPLASIALALPVPWIAMTMRGAAVLLAAAIVAFALIVTRQYRALGEARRRLGLTPRGNAATFLLWHYLGALVLVGPFIAYYGMVHNYNEVWHAVRHGRQPVPDDASPARQMESPRTAGVR